MDLKKILITTVWGGLAAMCACSAKPVWAIEPVSAGIVSGISVELLKGIANSVKGDDVAQVQVRAKTDGPDSDDKAFDGETDKDNLFFEYYLDARARAEAAQSPAHFAHGELHYEYTSGKGWQPNNISYITGEEWWGATVAYPDSTPEDGSLNKTEAAVVGAFAWNGVIEFGGYIDEDHSVVEVPDSPKIQATNAVLLEFELSQFATNVDPLDSNKVTVNPTLNMSQVDLFHNYAGYTNHDYFFSGLNGFNEFSNALAEETADSIASEAGLTRADPSTQAELTFGAASLFFDDLSIDRFKLVGGTPTEKTREELIMEYLDLLIISAPPNAQEGYTPNILGRTILLDGETIPFGGLEADLADRLPSTFSSDVGLFFYADSYLEDAINLAASTPGTPISSLVSSMDPGDTFSIDLSFGAGESFSRYDHNAVPEPASLLLFGTGIIGAFLNKRNKKI